MTIPVGARPGTYNGTIWIYAWANGADESNNNRTWTGLDNTTVTVAVAYGIQWELKPIGFGVLNPGTVGAKAIDNAGWPTNITVERNTNIYVDLYVNGTDLHNISEMPVIGSDNITYYNYTTQYDLPPDLSSSVTQTLENLRPTVPDFDNWVAIGNSTDLFTYWNISIPNVPGGEYYGNVTGRIFPTGETG